MSGGDSGKAPRYRVKAGGDTFAGVASQLYECEDVAGQLAACNKMAVDAPLEAGCELHLPARLFGQDGAVEKGETKAVVPATVHTPDLCWVRFDEELPTKDGVVAQSMVGKWIYVVADGEIVATVEGRRGGGFTVDNQLFGETQDIDDGWVSLRPNREYQFFVSPVALPESIKQRVAEQAADLGLPTLVPGPAALDAVALRDPFAWTAELHALRYQPSLEAWNSWRFESNRTAELFIGSTLKQLIGEKDELSIKGHLQDGQPGKWLKKYEEDDTNLRRQAEQAMADIASYVDSPAHQLIEMAAIENGGDDLRQAIVQWACFTSGACETLPGRGLVQRVTADENRLPRRLLFTESSTEADLSFKEHRFVANAGMAIMANLAPGLANVLRSRADKWEVLSLWLERLDGQKPLKGSYRRIKRALDQGRRITKSVVKDQRTLTKLLRTAESSRAEVVAVPKTLARAEKLTKAYERNLGAAMRTVGFLIESVNLAMALSDLRESSGGPTILEMILGTGAAADFGIVVVESFETLVAEGTKSGLKRAALVLGVVSGICDCIDFLTSAAASGGKHDYNAMVGQGIAAIGAAGVAVGSGIALAELGTGGAVIGGVTGVGLVVLLVGAGLITIGSVLAAWLSDNAYEQFAEHSFLGESSDAVPQQFAWAPSGTPLPTSSRAAETKALIAILSNFGVSSFSWDSVTINPGYYRDGDQFELFVHHAYNNYKLGPLECHVLVDLESGDVVQVAGNRPLDDSSVVRRDEAGRVTTIEVGIREGIPRPDLLLPFSSQTLWVRLKSKDGFTVPPRGDGRKDVWLRSYYYIDSLDRSNTTGNSIDPDRWVTAGSEGPPRDLPPMQQPT